METNLITLNQAESLGYAKRQALQKAINRGNLQAIRMGRDWAVTETWLKEAGYPNVMRPAPKQNPNRDL